ncbi:dihydrolipoyllysine-residue acetyltransferase component of pyruvate dehydrogenase complex-like [Prorops nasuta]|uniref:dihydrolipoyllysine-residue acetyltransferase component of pyruvate dehydrogenase complex-like n=1 Tax=Prorops nasuta TaxID=863751 RepID=UPI0034CFBA95
MVIPKMAQMVRCRIGYFTLKCSNRVVPRVFLPLKYQRLCFHTSWLLNVRGKEVLMPSLSPTMEAGTIVKWLKKEGEKIEPGDAIADIQTDKAVITMEYDDEGILAKIIIQEGAKDIKVGQLIALTVEPDEDWKSVELPSSTSIPSAASVSVSSESTESATPPPGQQNLAMPALSPTMTSGTIVKWLKKEGDEIEPGDAIADIQTDKAVMTFEIDDEGVLAKIISSEGSQVEVGQLIAIIVEKGMDWKNIVLPTTTAPVKSSAPAPSVSKPAATAAPAGLKPPSSGQVYGLAVKRLLEEYGLSSGQIKGTGRVNRLLKSDVLSYIQTNNVQKVKLEAVSPKTTKADAASRISAAAGKPSSYEDIPVSNIRAVIAKRLGESKSTIPHSYSTIDVKLDKLIDIRKKLKVENIKVSVNDFITKAVAHALLECPDINTLYQNGQIIRIPRVDISIAVATPTGLITPIVFDTVSKSLPEISETIKELAYKAKEGKLKPQEFQGGTFTISNLGMFGIKEFSAIINPPQTAILAVGSGREELDSSISPITRMTVTLSYDRRAISEDMAADFLAVLRAMLEEPTFLAVKRARNFMNQVE